MTASPGREDHQMDHPAAGGAAPSSFQRCRPEHRCGVCKLLDGQQRRERSLLRMILSQDEDFLATLEKLVALFYDAATTSA
jgi:hypothetical protein